MNAHTQSTSRYRLSSLFYPALIGTGVALTAAVVSGVGLHWIYHSSQLSRYANGALFITASAVNAAATTAFVIGLVVTFTQIKRNTAPSPLPSDRYFSAHAKPKPVATPQPVADIPLEPIAQNVDLSEDIKNEIEERMNSFKNFLVTLLKNEAICDSFIQDFKECLEHDLPLLESSDDIFLSLLLDDIIGVTFHSITNEAILNANVLYNLSWVPSSYKPDTCKKSLVDGVDAFFEYHPSLKPLKNKQMHSLMRSDRALNPLAGFIVSLCGSKSQTDWLKMFKESREAMEAHETASTKKQTGMIKFTALCTGLAL